MIFRAGYDPQTIEIGGVQVLDFGPDFPQGKSALHPGDLRRSRAGCAVAQGRGGTHRTPAQSGPHDHRHVDAIGNPLPGVKVRAQMKRSRLRLGQRDRCRRLFWAAGPDSERYRQIITENFNKVVLENDMKWGAWMANRQRALDAVAWLREHGLAVRGHVLVWPGKKNLPKDVAELLTQPEALRAAILEHIADEAGAFRGQLVEWDVVNEPYSEFDVQTALTGLPRSAAPDYIERHAATLVPFFRAAHQADPAREARHQRLLDPSKPAAKTTRTRNTTSAPSARSLPTARRSKASACRATFPRISRRYRGYGKSLIASENSTCRSRSPSSTSIPTTKRSRPITRAISSRPCSHTRALVGVLIWGFWEKRHWIPNAAFYRTDWSLRPPDRYGSTLCRKQWRTDV